MKQPIVGDSEKGNKEGESEKKNVECEGESEAEVQETKSRLRRRPTWLNDYHTSFFFATEEPISFEEAIFCESSAK